MIFSVCLVLLTKCFINEKRSIKQFHKDCLIEVSQLIIYVIRGGVYYNNRNTDINKKLQSSWKVWFLLSIQSSLNDHPLPEVSFNITEAIKFQNNWK
jgi:uncharacterized membrane protein (GlpM family)